MAMLNKAWTLHNTWMGKPADGRKASVFSNQSHRMRRDHPKTLRLWIPRVQDPYIWGGQFTCSQEKDKCHHLPSPVQSIENLPSLVVGSNHQFGEIHCNHGIGGDSSQHHPTRFMRDTFQFGGLSATSPIEVCNSALDGFLMSSGWPS